MQAKGESIMMFKLVYACIMISSSLIPIIAHARVFRKKSLDLVVLLEPRWENLEHGFEKIKRFGSKWILVGSITIKKKSKEPASLTTLRLKWLGPRIDHLEASLYKKSPDKIFLPIENNLISDGFWNESQQTLTFTFNVSQSLSVLNIFYLALTMPISQEERIKSGAFVVEPAGLPFLMRKYMDGQPLMLSFGTLDGGNN